VLAHAHGGDSIPLAGAMLVIEVDGEADTLAAGSEAIARAACGDGLLELLVAGNRAEVDALWAARKALSPALRTLSPNKINEDVVVPVSRVPELVAAARAIAAKHALPIVCGPESFGYDAPPGPGGPPVYAALENGYGSEARPLMQL
jgi:D-lactate dehydrogenase